jgi:TctA family transporter
MCLGIVVLTFLSHGSMLKALIMAVLGLWVGTIVWIWNLARLRNGPISSKGGKSVF